MTIPLPTMTSLLPMMMQVTTMGAPLANVSAPIVTNDTGISSCSGKCDTKGEELCTGARYRVTCPTDHDPDKCQA